MTIDPTQVWASADAAERWRRSAAQRQRAVGAVTELMLGSVGLEPGFRVLDLAAGTGDTSILAAQRVGPTGSVLGVDVSAAMLQEAVLAAKREGMTNVETLVSDIVDLDLPAASFDAAISRFGLMFLSDIVEGLRRIRLALKPGARLAAVVWSAEERNPYIKIPLAIAEKLMQQSGGGSPMRRATSLAGPGVFENALAKAEYSGISVQAAPTPREFDSLDAAVESIQQNSTVLRELMERLNPAQQEQAAVELRQRLSEFVRDGRCLIPGEALLGVAGRPLSEA